MQTQNEEKKRKAHAKRLTNAIFPKFRKDQTNHMFREQTKYNIKLNFTEDTKMSQISKI